MLQHSNTNWADVGQHVCQALTPPPPFPLVSMSLIRDTKRAGGGGGVAVGHLVTPVLRPNSPTALIYQIWQLRCHNWRITLLLREHPCQSTRARDVFCSTTPKLGGWEGGEEGWENQGEREGQAGGRGERGGKAGMHVLYTFEASPLMRKNYKAVTLESHPHLTRAIAIIITLVIRSSLKDWQSMKRVHTCAAQLAKPRFQIPNIYFRKGNNQGPTL